MYEHAVALFDPEGYPLDPIQACARCPHPRIDHYEDGPDADPTACAVVTYGDRACMCPGFVDGDNL